MIDLKSTNLYQEIHEQPGVLARVLLEERGPPQALAAEIRRRDISHVFIAARGTSDNAARYAQYLLGAVNGLPVGLTTPSLFSIYQRPPRFGNALVMGISQSGKSPDIVSVVAEARRQGALTATISNFRDSDLGQAADFVLELHAGEEKSLAATKTYTAELAAIALLSAVLSDDDSMMATLQQLPAQVAQALGSVSRDGSGGRALPLHDRLCRHRARLQLLHGLRDGAEDEGADLHHGGGLQQRRFSSRPAGADRRRLPRDRVAPSGEMLPDMLRLMATARERGQRWWSSATRPTRWRWGGSAWRCRAARRSGFHRWCPLCLASFSPCIWPTRATSIRTGRGR